MKFKKFFFDYLPHHFFSKLMASIMCCNIPLIKNYFIQQFVKKFDVNLGEAKIENISDYPNFRAFFTRQLKTNVRNFDTHSNVIYSPVDGKIPQFGKILNNQLIQAKGHTYTLPALLNDPEESVLQAFQQGSFMTLYLSPRDYHRIHMPIDGILKRSCYIPGKLFPVNDWSTTHIENVFARNERLILYFDTAFGKLAAVFVGAFIVSAIETPFHGAIKRNQGMKWQDFHQTVAKGEEIGLFNLGSTVILLLENSHFSFADTLTPNATVQLGQPLLTYNE